MAWFTTPVSREEDLKEKLDELDTNGYTIFNIITANGEIIIVSTK